MGKRLKARQTVAESSPANLQLSEVAGLWKMMVIVDRKEQRAVGNGHDGSRIASQARGLLTTIGRSESGGYIALVGVATPGFKIYDVPPAFTSHGGSIRLGLQRIVERAVESDADTELPTKPTFPIEREKLWARVVIESSLEGIHKKVNDSIEALTRLARMPVSDSPKKSQPLSPARQESLSQLFSGLSEDYDTVSAEVTAILSAAKLAAADRLGPALTIRAKEKVHISLDHKKELSRWVNSELEPLGLAIKCPRSGLPGKLRGIAHRDSENGKFAIEVTVNGKGTMSWMDDTFPELELTDANPSEQPEIAWSKKLPRRASHSAQGRF